MHIRHRYLSLFLLYLLLVVPVAAFSPQSTQDAQQPQPDATTVTTAPAGARSAPTGDKDGPAASPEPSAASVRFAVIGDTGTGKEPQLAVAEQMFAEFERAPFHTVLMLGDNIYGGKFKDIGEVFEVPYRKLLDNEVSFYATLGNHDQRSAQEQMNYPRFNMGGKPYYSFSPAPDLVEFFTIDSTRVLDNEGVDEQLVWLEQALKASNARWKIAYFHHPPYSPGKRHGNNDDIIETIVPVLIRNGVRVVLTGHEHFFAKIRQVDGIDYIISGSGGKIHRGGLQPDPMLEAGNDEEHQFLSVTLTWDTFDYKVIGLRGATLHSGSIPFERDIEKKVIENPPEP